jgi:hypothetical protein
VARYHRSHSGTALGSSGFLGDIAAEYGDEADFRGDGVEALLEARARRKLAGERSSLVSGDNITSRSLQHKTKLNYDSVERPFKSHIFCTSIHEPLPQSVPEH